MDLHSADMASLGQDLMLCKADDLDLINVIKNNQQKKKQTEQKTCLILHKSFVLSSFYLSIHPSILPSILPCRVMLVSADSCTSCSSFCLWFRAAGSRVAPEPTQSCCSTSSSAQRTRTSCHRCSSPHWTPGLHT